ncbi:MAG: CAP domain-containing protein [Candidatus Gottesmanbacteria bacterium]|nr:CAP domain-containing protein [Candidatus Gottesmanbacteria bacterium]
MPAKMNAKRKRRSAPRPSGIRPFLIIIFIMIMAISSAIPGSNTPLPPLPVPTRITETAYSGPLTLESFNVSVLGAQTIDRIDFVDEINKERVKVGAPPLRLSTVLMNAAKMRAGVILKYQNFSHQDPHEGIELGTVLPKLNYHFVYASENIGMGGVSAADFARGFMASTYHRQNLLDPRLTETGAAIVDGPYKQYYVNIAVQLFAIPGGEDEYRGYSPAERKLYENAYTMLSGKLNPFRRMVQKLLRNPDYSEKKITTYSRQKKILETVLVRMREDKPLQNPDVALILEYNTLL